MANSITINQKFYTTAQVEAHFGAKVVSCGLASDWMSIDVPHVVVTMDRGCYGEEQWIFVFESPVEVAEVPASIADRADWAITSIKKANQSLTHTRSLDVTFCGEGRYESDWFRNGHMAGMSIDYIGKFLSLAYKNGVDGCAWLVNRGYEAPLQMSDAARGWL